MELMSSLLLYALVAFFPQAIEQYVIDEDDIEVRQTAREFHPQNPQRNKYIYNVHGPPLAKLSEMPYLFKEIDCNRCIKCIERALNIYKKRNDVFIKRPLAIGSVDNSSKHRPKRKAVETLQKKIKPKKKPNKTVTITKYNIDGQVYGLRVKEISNNLKADQNDNKLTTCNIYSVKNSFECDTPASETFLVSAKRKVNSKKNKKGKDKENAETPSHTNTTDNNIMLATPTFKKRHVDQGRGDSFENFDPSMEDITSY